MSSREGQSQVLFLGVLNVDKGHLDLSKKTLSSREGQSQFLFLGVLTVDKGHLDLSKKTLMVEREWERQGASG